MKKAENEKSTVLPSLQREDAGAWKHSYETGSGKVHSGADCVKKVGQYVPGVNGLSESSIALITVEPRITSSLILRGGVFLLRRTYEII